MKKTITLAIVALALVAGGILTRVWAIDWPQASFREAQTAFNPVETILEEIPDLYWWSKDVDVASLAAKRGRAWTPVELDFGIQGAPDPIVAVGRQNQLVFYRPNLPRGLTAGAADPLSGTIVFGGNNGAQQETGVITTNPVVSLIPGTTPQRIIFVTHGLGVKRAPLTSDDPAYVQGVAISATDSTFTATALGKLKIQAPVTSGTPQETRITGMTFADIGDATTPLPLLFLTTFDGQVIAVDPQAFLNTASTDTIDPKKGIRWQWVNPGPVITTTGTPVFPANPTAFAKIPFNDGMNPAVGHVPLNALPDLTTLSDSARKKNLTWQDQVRLRNREWLVFVADRNNNAWAIEASGETKEEATNPGGSQQTLTGKATTRWTARIPGPQFPDRLGVPPVFWNGNTPAVDATGAQTGSGTAADDIVVFAGVGTVAAYNAQGNFLTADKPVFWDTSSSPPGTAPSFATGGASASPVVRKLGEADGTTERLWQFPEVGSSPPTDGRFAITVVRSMAAWAGPRQFANSGQDSANTSSDDDRLFIRWNEKYVRPLDRNANPPTEPVSPEDYVERIGSIAMYGSIETQQPIDTNQPIKITFTKSDTTYTIPQEFLSIVSQWTDTSRTTAGQQSVRGRIAIVRPVGLDSQDNPQNLNPGDKITIQYTPVNGSAQTTERNLPYPSRVGRDLEPTPPAGQTAPASGEIVPTSFGRLAVTIQNEGTANDKTDELITRPQTEDDYNPSLSDITQFGLIPGMSIANDELFFGSRYRGRVYVIEAQTLLLRGEIFNTSLEQPSSGTAPDPVNDLPAAIDPIGNPAIADGWLYVSYGNGFLGAYANPGGGGGGVDIEPPADSPFGRRGSGRSAINMPQIRLTDSQGNPITDEDKLRFDWGQPLKLIATFPDPGVDTLSLSTNPIRVTIRGPMGDLPPVTVSPTRETTGNTAAGVATVDVIIPNASPANPMTPGTPLLSEVPDVSKRAGTPHWELRAEQIGTNWRLTDAQGNVLTDAQGNEQIGPWEPDRNAPSWRPESNRAPWVTLNNPIGLAYGVPGGGT
jgi:hypothetical protein